MTFMLRDRPDGMVEIVLQHPVLIGIFPERDIAQRVCTFLEAEDFEVPDLADASDGAVAADLIALGDAAASAWETALSGVEKALSPAPAPPRTRTANLPVVIPDKPRPPVLIQPAPVQMTEDQISAAYLRIGGGEKIAVVAADYGLSMFQLRGMWANHKRRMQAHIAEGGQKPCALCKRQFTPSISHPDTCARCNHG